MINTNCDNCNEVEVQSHVHEFLGSVILGNPQNRQNLTHNHRFSGVTGPEIPSRTSHIHIISTKTDFFFNHFHEIELETGPAIIIRDENSNPIGHIHVIVGTSSCVFFHDHDFRGTTLIQNPIGPILVKEIKKEVHICDDNSVQNMSFDVEIKNE